MILLFEEYNYPQSLLNDVLEGFDGLCTPLKSGKAKVQYVGYFFSPEKQDSIFILPKVFVSYNKQGEAKAFGKYQPEEIVFIDANSKERESEEVKRLFEDGNNTIIFELSVWIYRAIMQFINRHGESGIVEDCIIQNPVEANGERSQTMLDIVLQLLDFHKKHHNLFTYISIVNSSGNNKIHWTKTISKTQPIIKDNKPYYIEFKNKNKVINFDEELIVLFYSTLRYLSDTFNFRVKSDVQYKLLSPHKISALLEDGRGLRLLKQIRRKYFSDELVKLWKLLYAFFEKAEAVKSRRAHKDKLLVKNFNIVFEDMIDYLVGSKTGEISDALKYQEDGKIVDHIYKHPSLIDDDLIYYVGDSKYYSSGNNIGKNSIYKQFTYAKNIIQYNIDVLYHWGAHEKSTDTPLRYRDDVTEGYNITPNFFIRGSINPDNISYNEWIKSTDTIFHNKHFYNRLFDRDTMILKEYDINFLYVLSAYAVNVESDNRTRRLRTMFRNDLIEAINDVYVFFKIKSKVGSIEQVVAKHFYEFAGRMYISRGEDCAWIALEKGKEFGVDGNKNYPSIDSFSQDAWISEPITIAERSNEFGMSEKYFEEPIFKVVPYPQPSTSMMVADKKGDYKPY